MKIKYLRMKNFLSIGEDGIEIDFTKLGNIVNIKGVNLDAGGHASNGSGKSTLVEGLVYGLYGKLIKGLSHKEAINVKSKRGLEVEVWWDDYRVLRKRAPDRLHLWHKDEEISLSGIPATDELIRNIVKLNYNSFINVACFGQHNMYAFLSCDAKEKREIAENLLSLDKYVLFSKTAKDKLKGIKEKVSQSSLLCQSVKEELEKAEKKRTVLQSQQQQWRTAKQKEITTLESKVVYLEKQISLGDVDSKDGNQEDEASRLDAEIARCEKNRADLHAILEKADQAIQQRRDEKQDLAIEASRCERELVAIHNEIESLEESCDTIRTQAGKTCAQCFGEIKPENIDKMLQRDVNRLKTLRVNLLNVEESLQSFQSKLDKCQNTLDRLSDGRRLARDKEIVLGSQINDHILKRQRFNYSSQTVLLEKDLEHARGNLQQSLTDIQNDPYASMLDIVTNEIAATQEKLNFYTKEIDQMKEQIPYLNFWVRAFGDDGIRSFVINEIIPALNARINYWLQFLMDGRVQLRFDNQLEEVIEKVPYTSEQFVYNGLSGGEHSRIDLAISQAFAHVMMMTSGTCPSIVALDEVAAHIDRPGMQALYKMICELSRDRQVLVITHDPDLLDMLSGYDTIKVVMKNGKTTLSRS